MTTQRETLQVLTSRLAFQVTLPVQKKFARASNGAIDPGRQSALSRTMTVRDRITNKLNDAFAPQQLSVIDESHLHEGHAGHRAGGETHFRVEIMSSAFAGKSRIDRHRMINAALASELADRVHALAIKAAAPDEG